MRRTRIVAKLTALSLMLSGLPITSVYGAELPEPAEIVEQEAEGEANSQNPGESLAGDIGKEETDPDGSGASAEQQKDTQDAAEDLQQEDLRDDLNEEETPEETGQSDLNAEEAEQSGLNAEETEQSGLNAEEAEQSGLNAEETEQSGLNAEEAEQNGLNAEDAGKKSIRVAENAKMAGSNGILYDDVTYLSARNVLAMDEETQEVYRALCDEIAVSREGGLELQDVVLAVDADGDLYCSYYVPMRALEEIEAEFLPDTNGTLTPAAAENTAEKKGDGGTVDGEDGTKEEKKDGETSGGGQGVPDVGQNTGEDEKKDDGASGGAGQTAGEDEKKDDEASGAGGTAGEDEKKDDEASGTGQTAGEDEKKDDGASGAGGTAGEDEKKDDEASDAGQTAGEDEKKDDEASGAGQTAGEDEKKDDGASDVSQDTGEDEKKDDEASDESQNTEEDRQDDETSSDVDQDIVEEQREEEAVDGGQNAEEEEYTLFEENLDEISEIEEETFEVVEPVRVENTIDLGYGSGASDGLNRSGQSFDSWLPQDDYFVKQLTSTQKKYYNAAKEELLDGKNSFSFQESLSAVDTVGDNVAHAISALILNYPDRTDWIAKPGGFGGSIKYKRGARRGTFTFTLDKSPYYSPSLDEAANNNAQVLGGWAQQYAAANYPNAPAYGIVKYFDQWICENGYYEMAGTQNPTTSSAREVYYYCHSVYGILLGGFGVCESYAKTMSRLLDAVGIPNMYVVGMAGQPGNQGGHAWNYVQMPDGRWYLQDSTWNDTTDKAHTASTTEYLLAQDDGMHSETGCNYVGETPDFEFPERSYSKYVCASFSLSQTQCDLLAKEKLTLTCSSDVSGTWSSSNTKVAKVDKNGKVTAVAGGTATITFAGEGMTAKCTVNVEQVKAVKVKDTKKTSESVSLGIDGEKKDSRDIVLSVDMGNSPCTAEEMMKQGKADAPAVTYAKSNGVAMVTAAPSDVKGNEITVHVLAQKEGSVNATVKFAGKSVTFKVSVGKQITKEMFDITWPAEVTGEEDSKTTAYTGKAIKPKIKKKQDAVYKPVKFKVTYVNNKDAGEAKVVVTGSGTYGGRIEYPFTITPLNIESAEFSNALKDKVYNGGANPPATKVKFNGKSLKVNRDYEILYTQGDKIVKENLNVVPVGSYMITIRGIGNYTGEVSRPGAYQVTKNTIAKVSVTGAGSAKYTGVSQNPFTAKIGKNVLPESDYIIRWYKGQGKAMSSTPMSIAPAAKGKYTAVITVQGSNLTTTARKKEIKKNFTIK